MIDILFAHNDEAIPEPFLPPDNLSAKPFQRWKNRRMSRFLLRTLLEKHGFSPDLVQNMQRAKNGRPYLVNPQIDFNISDSGDWVAVIFSCQNAKKAKNAKNAKRVGIDIEFPQKARRFEALIQHYADQTEIEQLLRQPQAVLPHLNTLEQRFYLSWCLREAVLKTQGVGIVQLSAVRHRPSEQQIHTAYCPKGTLHFYHQLPFFLAYFFEGEFEGEGEPNLSQWQAGKWQKITEFRPLVYGVN